MKKILVIATITGPAALFAQSAGDTKAVFFNYNFWTLLLGVIIVTMGGYVMYLKVKLTGLERRISSLKREPFQPTEQVSVRVLKDIQDLKDQVNNIHRKLKPAQVPQPQIANPVSTVGEVYRATEERSKEIELKVPDKPKQEVFYMATPNEDGTFDVAGRSNEFRGTQSLYRFTAEAGNNNKATFCFYSDEAGLQDAVNYPHTYITPVCDPQNALNQNARSIRTIRTGTAEKRNDKWVVTTKTQISYE